MASPTSSPSAEVSTPPSSSSPSSSSYSAIPPTHIATLLPIKLTRDNYILWKSLLIPILQNSSLYDILDGSETCPSPTLSPNQPNPAYAEWIIKDRTCKIWLHAALSDSVLPYTVGCTSAKALLDNLEKRFAAITRSHILQLKGQLQALKKGSDSMMQYLERIKSLADGLAAAGAPLDDLDLIAHILRGLPPAYNSFGTSIRVRADPIDPDTLHGLLVSEEIEILQRETLAPNDSSSSFQAFYTTSPSRPTSFHTKPKGPSSQRFPPKPPLLPTPSFSSPRPNTTTTYQPNPSFPHSRYPQDHKVRCQICNKLNHTAVQCRHRSNYAYQGRSPPQQFSAMTATHLPSPPSSPSSLWYADSGATNHITHDLNNLSLKSSYPGTDKVIVGNGEGHSNGEAPISWPY